MKRICVQNAGSRNQKKKVNLKERMVKALKEIP